VSDDLKAFPRKVGEWTELNRKEVYDNPWILVSHSEVLNPNGGSGIYGKVHFKNLAIGVIAIDAEDNIYLVGQERFPFDGAYTWEIIEGGGPLDEEPLHSAKRELMEEAGLKAQHWERILEMQLSNSVSDEVGIIYIAQDLSQHQAQPDDNEKLQIKKLPFREALEMVFSGKIVDSLSVAGILRLALLRQITN
jgi:8-oxo-dGTP pyrophosphatase MutT (NUDIX family)